MNKIPLFLALIFVLAFPGCQPAQNDDFAIYLLASDIPTTELSKIDIQALDLEDRPLIRSDDILSYDRTGHILKLTRAAYDRVQEIFPKPVRMDGIPFVVCVGEERIYTGAFWTPLSSLSYEGVVIMEPWDEKDTTLQITLGYPGSDFFTGKDPRADSRILQALEEDQKLK